VIKLDQKLLGRCMFQEASLKQLGLPAEEAGSGVILLRCEKRAITRTGKFCARIRSWSALGPPQRHIEETPPLSARELLFAACRIRGLALIALAREKTILQSLTIWIA
jgi:hypothetical protein